MDLENYNWCLTLPQEFASATDFEADSTIDLDYSIKLPSSFSLWIWIHSTNYQWAYWSCTSNATCHGVQVLNVMQWWVQPTDSNIITPSWRDLWWKMWHNINDINDSWDYVENAVSTALKLGVFIEENWELARFDGYATTDFERTDKGIEKIKRYLYNGNPIVWVLQGNKKAWDELSAWELKTVIPVAERKWWHAIACVWWDETWLWFVNSWRTNDWKWLKSRFHVWYKFLKNSGTMFNWRYWVLFIKEQANQNPEYLKRKNRYIAVLSELRKTYPEESKEMQKAIEQFSQICRKKYREIDKELPINE